MLIITNSIVHFISRILPLSAATQTLRPYKREVNFCPSSLINVYCVEKYQLPVNSTFSMFRVAIRYTINMIKIYNNHTSLLSLLLFFVLFLLRVFIFVIISIFHLSCDHSFRCFRGAVHPPPSPAPFIRVRGRDITTPLNKTSRRQKFGLVLLVVAASVRVMSECESPRCFGLPFSLL